MISFNAAQQCYRDTIQPLDCLSLPITEALGYTLRQAPAAALDLPSFTQSAVDGYAARSADTTTSCTLKLIGEIAAGDAPGNPETPNAGEVMRIFTGAALPDWADTVIRQELVTKDDNHIHLTAAVSSNRDVRHRGEELTTGTQLAQPGQQLSAGLLAALAMAGVTTVTVTRQPKCVVLISGNEVVPPGQALQPGQIVDANGPLIQNWFKSQGLPTPELHYIEDTEAATRQAIANGFDHYDLVITTGGVSVGDYDFIPSVTESLGATQHFWKVAQKPGKPIYFAQQEQSYLIGLPGNPAAVLIGLVCHVANILAYLSGHAEPEWLTGKLAEPVQSDDKRVRLVRMRGTLNEHGEMMLHPLPKQQSHMLSNLVTANCLVYIASNQPEINLAKFLYL